MQQETEVSGEEGDGLSVVVNSGEGFSADGFLCRMSLVFGGVRQGGDSGGRLWVKEDEKSELLCFLDWWKTALVSQKCPMSGKSQDWMKTLDVTEEEVGCPGKVLNRDEKRVIKGCCEQRIKGVIVELIGWFNGSWVGSS
ncbi:unnamed protein product [Lactuca saligna]|uniref:Uncharacterized protein n=1 Tax=Lactuca saligna TaxID=75948 RepID=A0AA35Z026_LACSI|nr:unnamed protein product [Lactuca saligna]